ncbi:MAG TPA: response regulator [Candidatus Obscuribacterales bacterium]
MLKASDFGPSSPMATTSSEVRCITLPQAKKMPAVLLVDDDDDNLFLLEKILEQFTCTITLETEGNTALEIAKQLKPNLILLDIWLPGINGIEITQALRQDPLTAKIPIVAVTALASDRDRQSVLKAGCNQYVSKPYVLEVLEDVLNLYLTPRPEAL